MYENSIQPLIYYFSFTGKKKKKERVENELPTWSANTGSRRMGAVPPSTRWRSGKLAPCLFPSTPLASLGLHTPVEFTGTNRELIFRSGEEGVGWKISGPLSLTVTMKERVLLAFVGYSRVHSSKTGFLLC